MFDRVLSENGAVIDIDEFERRRIRPNGVLLLYKRYGEDLVTLYELSEYASELFRNWGKSWASAERTTGRPTPLISRPICPYRAPICPILRVDLKYNSPI